MAGSGDESSVQEERQEPVRVLWASAPEGQPTEMATLPADSVAATTTSDSTARPAAARPSSAKSASPTEGPTIPSPPSPKTTETPPIPDGAKNRKGSKSLDAQIKTEPHTKPLPRESSTPPKDSTTNSDGGSKPPAPSTRKPSSPTDPAALIGSNQSTPDNMSPLPKTKQKSSKSPPVKYEPQLYGDLPDVTAEAKSQFEVIDECIYTNKWIGDSGQDSEFMPCECKADFGASLCVASVTPGADFWLQSME